MSAPTFTLDTNCLIALEEERPEASAVRQLLARHRQGEAVVEFAATMAAETQTDGTVATSISSLLDRLAAASLEHIELIRPVMVLDLVYLDWCVPASEGDDNLLRQIHEVLFPTPFDYRDAVPDALDGEERSREESRWRNKRLDGLALHCHIRAGNHVFVTSDRNFTKATKRGPLAELGAAVILTPQDAASHSPDHLG
ncbi:hypothetical protein JOF53_000009 [Crossiella equi]|uniref:PIN domain-containing protein n=1 Tax=Crossiella equi TaxID=130796 RepID=A0ABS5A4I4_9PSEU|nr:hypothetical protein [Crossiella equi]MBP2471137.1 hypothetical protein [Crossiella equi]